MTVKIFQQAEKEKNTRLFQIVMM